MGSSSCKIETIVDDFALSAPSASALYELTKVHSLLVEAKFMGLITRRTGVILLKLCKGRNILESSIYGRSET